ncbi:MAG: SbmA/BacA-like family transporter, partial [Pseudomonadota bacterium]
MVIWYMGGSNWGAFFGLGEPTPEDGQIVGIQYFYSPSFLWLYVYYIIAVAIFSAFWFRFSPHPWQLWSIPGSAVILFATYFGVQISVALNNWRRPFFDQVQAALTEGSTVSSAELYDLILVFAVIAFMAIFLFVATRFFVSHWIFRWRTAMNDYYMRRWGKLRHIEGAAQRVQEDTMRFAGIMEGLGVSMVDAVMTLIAFLPLLWGLSSYVAELPVVGAIPAPLFTAA